MRFPGVAPCATVSVGIAMTTGACRTLPALMATADRALCRAKAEGRNRVAPAPLVMLETRANAARLPVDIGAGTALAAPMAGYRRPAAPRWLLPSSPQCAPLAA
jgi:hypothetical protein